MPLVRRIFHMVGGEAYSINRVVSTLAEEDIPSPRGKRRWSRTLIRNIINDDVYKPHSVEEIEGLLAPEVAAQLDPKKQYGVWWYNRRRVVQRQVVREGADGKVYRKTSKLSYRPPEEWIAVPVPDAGIPREVVESARQSLADNAKPSAAGESSQDLSPAASCAAACAAAT